MRMDKSAVVEVAETEAVPPRDGGHGLLHPKPWQGPEALREHFRRVHASIRRGKPESVAIAVCSLSRGEGVSYVAAGLACASAEVDNSVFLLDANRHHPAQARVFGLENVPGSRLASAGVPGMVACKTSWPNLTVVLPEEDRGPKTIATAWLLHALGAMRLLAKTTIVDCEAWRESSQVVQLASALDGVFFVVEAERERREAIADAVAQMKRAGIPVLGLIVNKQRRYLPSLLYRSL